MQAFKNVCLLQVQYQQVLQERDQLAKQLHIDDQQQGFNPESPEPMLDERHPLEQSESLQEDIIDWKLKSEIATHENDSLRLKLAQSSSMPPPRSPLASNVFEFRSQYDALVEQNELLRAQLGARASRCIFYLIPRIAEI